MKEIEIPITSEQFLDYLAGDEIEGFEIGNARKAKMPHKQNPDIILGQTEYVCSYKDKVIYTAIGWCWWVREKYFSKYFLHHDGEPSETGIRFWEPEEQGE